MLKTAPAVFAVGNHYQIMMETQCEALVSIRVGQKTYYDESNGIMNSLSPVHRVSIPTRELERAGAYTVSLRPVRQRKPYFTETEVAVELTYPFKPIPAEKIRIYHLSDTHNQIAAPVNAAKAFGSIDLLVLNGDIIDHSGDLGKFINIYEICAAITGGSIPVVFSRGNHDMRGIYAEKFADYTPSQYKNTYYTFKVGSIWGIILDCGEDKVDAHPEYGFTVACHAFRERQIDYINQVIENAETEYASPDVKTRLVISHIPFTQHMGDPFDIEPEIYKTWAALLKGHIKPHLMICGHMHQISIDYPGGENDLLGLPCPLVVASQPQSDRFISCGFIVNGDNVEVVSTDSLGNTAALAVVEK